MFKTLLTAAALTLVAAGVQAATGPVDLLPLASASNPRASIIDQVAYFCQWVTVYDYYGNWVTVWRCY